MTPFPALALVIAACAGFVSPASVAQSLRCKSDLANLGDSKSSVLLKCGEPVVRDAFCRPAAPDAAPAAAPGSTVVTVAPCRNIDEWTYKPGYGQFVTTLQFEEGVLKGIKYGERIK